jgi:fibronectin type 3 domain-containing protein
VASGYTRVSPATVFSTAQGYGWQSGTIDSRDRGTGSDLNRDFDFTTDGTFAVNLANGSYNVTVTMGDASYPHDQMGVFLQGIQVDSVTTAAGSFVTTTYSVTVSGGQLTLRLKDLGGSDLYAVINALLVVSA